MNKFDNLIQFVEKIHETVKEIKKLVKRQTPKGEYNSPREFGSRNYNGAIYNSSEDAPFVPGPLPTDRTTLRLRARNTLDKSEITCASQVTWERLGSIRNCGTSTYNEIVDWIKADRAKKAEPELPFEGKTVDNRLEDGTTDVGLAEGVAASSYNADAATPDTTNQPVIG